MLLYFARLRLPAAFRVPYHLVLALFFLYPLVLTPFWGDPSNPALHWALFLFCPTAGVVFLSLLPAAVMGPRYARKSGGPWRRPRYPWVLFATLALCVLGRSYMLCVSFHSVSGKSTLFAPYFWVPFLCVLNLLLLEFAHRSRLPRLRTSAMILPAALLALAATAPFAEEHAGTFFDRFVDTLGGTPLYWTLAWTVLFYSYALLRRVRYATAALIVALLLAAIVEPRTVDPATLSDPRWLPLLAAGIFWTAAAAWTMRSQHWMLAAAFLICAADAACRGTAFDGYCDPLFGTLLLTAYLVIGATFQDPFARILRDSGPVRWSSAECSSSSPTRDRLFRRPRSLRPRTPSIWPRPPSYTDSSSTTPPTTRRPSPYSPERAPSPAGIS